MYCLLSWKWRGVHYYGTWQSFGQRYSNLDKFCLLFGILGIVGKNLQFDVIISDTVVICDKINCIIVISNIVCPPLKGESGSSLHVWLEWRYFLSLNRRHLWNEDIFHRNIENNWHIFKRTNIEKYISQIYRNYGEVHIDLIV